VQLYALLNYPQTHNKQVFPNGSTGPCIRAQRRKGVLESWVKAPCFPTSAHVTFGYFEFGVTERMKLWLFSYNGFADGHQAGFRHTDTRPFAIYSSIILTFLTHGRLQKLQLQF
jgi:hypothetical protein